MRVWLVVLATALSARTAEARVFQFKNETFSSYIRSAMGLSSVGASAFEDASGTGTSFDDEVKYNLSGEFGFGINFGENATLRLGLEVLQAKSLTNIPGTNASGVKRMDLTSEVFIYSPTVALEFNYHKTQSSRAFAGLAAGWATATLDNAYQFTATGLSELGVSGNYTEKAEATRLSWQLNTGYEVLFTDTVTAVFELGYRYLPLDSLAYKSAVTTISGPKAKGARLTNADGSAREIDMSGVFLAVGFRFYIKAR